MVFGDTEIEAPVKFPGDQVNVPPGTVAVADKVPDCPAQIVLPGAVTTGVGLMVTVTGVKGEVQPVNGQVIVHNPLFV